MRPKVNANALNLTAVNIERCDNQSKLLNISILGYRMETAKGSPNHHAFCPLASSPIPYFAQSNKNKEETPGNPHLAFEKNYPKNIFITLIEHLAELGLKEDYQDCVGTRESFQSKNVVSLAEIHRVISQKWFQETINLTALVSNMSNKILMNSKIKKKLFHLLLIRDLFALPSSDCKDFKKLVSKKAGQITQSGSPNHSLFSYPSALIYLLRVFSHALSPASQETISENFDSEHQGHDEQGVKPLTPQIPEQNAKVRTKEPSSKEESKLYMSRIISSLNHYSGDMAELFDLLKQIKFYIEEKEQEIRDLYQLPKFVPEWSYFGNIVIDNCMLAKKNRQKVTFSVLNQWIQQFKDMGTSNKGFVALTENTEGEESYPFQPIILIKPPQLFEATC